MDEVVRSIGLKVKDIVLLTHDGGNAINLNWCLYRKGKCNGFKTIILLNKNRFLNNASEVLMITMKEITIRYDNVCSSMQNNIIKLGLSKLSFGSEVPRL